jgi:hypothetical protein
MGAGQMESQKGTIEMSNGDTFRWVVGGVLAACAALVGVLWFMLMAEVGDLKVGVRGAEIAIGDLKAETKIQAAELKDVANRIAEMQGMLERKIGR